MKIKTVSTMLTTNTAGQVVESRPVRSVDEGPLQDTAGNCIDPIAVEEADDGVPVRFVETAVVLNSAGQPVAATPVTGVGVIKRILGAGGVDYAEFNFRTPGRMFQDTAGTIPADTAGQVIGLVRALNGTHTAQQATDSFRSKIDAFGIVADGLDDRWSTDWLSQNGANCALWDILVPAVVSTSNFVGGMAKGGFSNNFLFGFGAAGKLRANIGQTTGTSDYGPDLRGMRAVCAVSADNSECRFFVNGVMVATAPRSASPLGSDLPWLINAYQNDATPSAFSSARMAHIAFGRVQLTEADVLAYYNERLAAA